MESAEPSENQSKLSAVVARYVDSRDGYAHAAKLVDETDLSTAFVEISKKRAAVAKKLTALVTTDQDSPSEENGTLEGAAHRWWMGVRESMSSEELHAILSECVRGEKVLAGALEDAIKSEDMNDETRSLMTTALADVQMAIEHFKFSGVES